MVWHWNWCFIVCIIHQITFPTHYSIKNNSDVSWSLKDQNPSELVKNFFIMENIKNEKTLRILDRSRFRWLVLDFCCFCFIFCITHKKKILMLFLLHCTHLEYFTNKLKNRRCPGTKHLIYLTHPSPIWMGSTCLQIPVHLCLPSICLHCWKLFSTLTCLQSNKLWLTGR